MKKQLLTFCLSIIVLSNNFAQNQNKCATMPVYTEHMKNQLTKANFINAEVIAKNWLANPINKSNAQKKTKFHHHCSCSSACGL